MKRAAKILAVLAILSSCHKPSPPRREASRPVPPRGLPEILVEAPAVLAPGSKVGIRVALLQSTAADSVRPSGGAPFDVTIGPRRVFSGKTGPSGSAAIEFAVPDLPAGRHPLRVRTTEREVAAEVTIEERPKVLLTTDKPIYQPGQTIHLRALALESFTMRAFRNQEIAFDVRDGKDNVVFRRRAMTSEFGVASLDFTLADEVNCGIYKVSAALGKTRFEHSVEVKTYVLPKFKIEISADKTFYAPKETLRGSLEAKYLFGKPVADADVTVRARAPREFASARVRTDREGKAQFEFRMPASDAVVEISASVLDAAEHEESATRKWSVTAQSVILTCIPESGKVVPLLENTVYFLAASPDGSPVSGEFQVTITGITRTLRTSEAGFASFVFDATREQIRLVGERTVYPVEIRGPGIQSSLALDTESPGDNLLLRADRATYRAGEVIRLDVHSTAARDWVFLDLVRKGQTVLATTCEIRDHRGSHEVVAGPDLAGLVEVHAYKLRRDGSFLRDARLIYVRPAEELKVAVESGSYRPGETAKISLHVTDLQGRGVEACLGVAVVDEAVYAIQEMRPGLEQLFFTLERELRKPRYQIRNCLETDELGRALFSNLRVDGDRRVRIDTLAQRKEEASRRFDTVVKRVHEFLYSQEESWERHTAVLSYVDLAETYPAGDSVAYAFTLVKSRHAQTVELRVGLTGGMRAWVNGGLVIDDPETVSAGAIDQRRARVRLEAGWNRLLLRLSNHHGDWRFIARFVDASNLTVSTGGKQLRLGEEGSVENWIGLGAFPDDFGGTQSFIDERAASPRAGMEVHGRTWSSLNHRAYYPRILRERILDRMVREGTLAPADILDPWGRRIVVPVREQEILSTMMEEKAVLKGLAYGGRFGGSAKQEPPARVREWFPETLYWNPCVMTDANGRATLEIPLADSITTWRLSALANTRGGVLGSADRGIVVFQDFFVDIDFPRHLTQNDRVSVPVALYNYSKEPNPVELRVVEEPWFELLDPATREVALAPGAVSIAYFRIRVRKIGAQKFTVWAKGAKLSDAIRREVDVLPDGKKVETVINANLTSQARHQVVIPEDAVAESGRILFKLYPGVMAQIVDGLAGMLRMPHG